MIIVCNLLNMRINSNHYQLPPLPSQHPRSPHHRNPADDSSGNFYQRKRELKIKDYKINCMLVQMLNRPPRMKIERSGVLKLKEYTLHIHTHAIHIQWYMKFWKRLYWIQLNDFMYVSYRMWFYHLFVVTLKQLNNTTSLPGQPKTFMQFLASRLYSLASHGIAERFMYCLRISIALFMYVFRLEITCNFSAYSRRFDGTIAEYTVEFDAWL